jgi:Holliday junction resolvasome RuvABC endonuclease subunit
MLDQAIAAPPQPPARAHAFALNRNILALDLATVTGWAYVGIDGVMRGGSESFQPRPSWTKGQRALRFRQWLAETLTNYPAHVVVYEKVMRHTSTDAAHLYGLLEGLVHMAADTRNLKVLEVGVSTVKKEWTGNGAADKDMMVDECKRRGFRPDDHNHADAIAILDWAIGRELGRPLKFAPTPKRNKPAPVRKVKGKAATPQGALL